MPDAAAIVELTDSARRAIAVSRATCPFIGSLVVSALLSVRHDADNPLAAIDDVRALGNSGGGDLGDLLAIFASGNHAFMRGDGTALDRPVPAGLFSLEFPGSQGSHPGHSGILEGDPAVPGSGRFSQSDFERLTRRAHDGHLSRSEVAAFIAESLRRDPHAKVFGARTALLLADDLRSFVLQTGPSWLAQFAAPLAEANAAHRALEQKLTDLLGEDNLVGSAGEFGLLFALFANAPGARSADNEPMLPLAGVSAMFVDKRLPDGWERWKKRRADWLLNTSALLIGAGKAYSLSHDA